MFAGVRADPVDLVALSDVPSFLGSPREDTFLDEVALSLKAGAVVVVRGHLRVLTPSCAAFEDISASHQALIDGESTKLWTIHVYRRS